MIKSKEQEGWGAERRKKQGILLSSYLQNGSQQLKREEKIGSRLLCELATVPQLSKTTSSQQKRKVP